MDKRTFLKSAGIVGLGSMMSIDNLAELVRGVSAVSQKSLPGMKTSGLLCERDTN